MKGLRPFIDPSFTENILHKSYLTSKDMLRPLPYPERKSTWFQVDRQGNQSLQHLQETVLCGRYRNWHQRDRLQQGSLAWWFWRFCLHQGLGHQIELCAVCNHSILNGKTAVSEYLRDFRLTLLSKNSNPTLEISKTHPIAMSSTITRVLEKAILLKLESLGSKLFDTPYDQVGFRKSVST